MVRMEASLTDVSRFLSFFLSSVPPWYRKQDRQKDMEKERGETEAIDFLGIVSGNKTVYCLTERGERSG